MDEAAQRVWRKGILPLVTREGLKALLKAIVEDDARLIQGATTQPPPLQATQDWPIEAADALTFLFWQGQEGWTVGECEEAFVKACFDVDMLLTEPAACRMFLNWYDETPRDEMRTKLMKEIYRTLE